MSLFEESLLRVKAMNFGDPVTNVCAGDKNPQLHCYFVAYKITQYRSRYGVLHRSHWANCTDKNGKFWNTDIKVIHPGHLDAETRAKLFAPVWQETYGDKTAAPHTPQGGDTP